MTGVLGLAFCVPAFSCEMSWLTRYARPLSALGALGLAAYRTYKGGSSYAGRSNYKSGNYGYASHSYRRGVGKRFVSRDANKRMISVRAPSQHEMHHVDIAITNVDCDMTGSGTCLSVIPQGAGIHDRTGTRVRFRSVDLRLHFTNSGNADAVSRYMVVVDRQTNGTAVGWTSLLTVLSPYAPFNMDYGYRYQVKKDETFLLETTNGINDEKWIQRTIPLGTYCTYNDVNGTVGETIAGSVYLMMCGSIAHASSHVVVSGWVRIYFEDI